nr:lysine-specific demethylase 2A-like isoform X1 [Lytechinus pictus]
MTSQTETGRSLRHKVRRHYDEGEHQDDEIEGRRTFTLDDKLTTDRYNFPMVKTMSSQDFTLQWLQENGFDTPLLFKESTHLDIRTPDSTFTVSDVKQFVGSRRVVDVMDVNTQKGIEMTMAQFARYYESPDRKELYNVISLEFSHTRLADAVQQPKVVRQIDWVNNVWPRHLIDTQRDSTNILAEMKYPKVQKYCLMSVKGCYTDFHVDFGGTSVWYHILRGSKVFWLIPPTDENLETYETWVLSGKQGDIFLGDRVMECGRIRLEAGDTFMIPTGWIHAVYTPEDSLVFGGNILHTFNVRKQLGVWQLEDRTRVPTKFRYPFYFEIHWFALARYVEVLLGRQHVRQSGNSQVEQLELAYTNNGHSIKQENGIDVHVKADEEEEVQINHRHRNVKVEDEDEMSDAILKSLAMGQTMDMDTSDDKDYSFEDSTEKFEIKFEPTGSGGGEFASTSSLGGVKEHVHLSWAEMEGLINLVEFLESLPRSKRSVPELIENPDQLLEDAREMLELHQDDDPGLGVTGIPVVKWPDPPPKPPVKLKPLHSGVKRAKKKKKNKSLTMNRKRRTRCKNCANCTRADCGECNYCLDMKKYGGPGRMKQSCIKRQCLTPILPGKSSCSICKQEDCDAEGNTTLFECYVCHDITHPACVKEQGFEAEGVMNEELTNSWECPKCVEVEDDDDEEEEDEDEEESGHESDGSSEKSASARGRKRKADNDDGSPDAGTPGKRVSQRGKGPSMASTSTYQGTLRTRLRHRGGNTQQLAKKKVRQAKYHMQKSSLKGKAMAKRHTWQPKKRHPGRPPKLQAQVEPKPIIMEKIPACAAPKFVVRPASANPPAEFVLMADETKHPIHRDDWMTIFQFLDRHALNECMAVCKTWNRWCIHPSLWKKISLARVSPLTKSALCGIVRRQPLSLNLSWTNISAKQLSWLLPRLPNLKELSLGGSTWPVVYSLASVACPFLTSLDLQWVSTLNDSSLMSLLSPPNDHRPGYFDERSRLSNIERLCLSGADITDATMSAIVQYAPLLAHLDVSFCGNLTDASIRILLDEKSPVRMTLRELNIAGCRKMTLSVFSQLESCPTLKKLIVHSCPNLAQEACLKFTEQKGVEMVTNKPRRMCRTSSH